MLISTTVSNHFSSNLLALPMKGRAQLRWCTPLLFNAAHDHQVARLGQAPRTIVARN